MISHPPRHLALVALVALAACDRPPTLPDMGLSATAVVFDAPPASGDPVAQSIYVTNIGEGSLSAPAPSVAYLDGQGWLTAAVLDSRAPYQLRLAAAVGTLAPGQYRATVTLACANASSSPLQVAATLNVPDPRFATSVPAVTLLAPRGGGDPGLQTVLITNGGRGTLPVPQVAVSYVGPPGWLATQVDGSPAGYALAVAGSAAGLASGTYSATLTLTATGDAAPPRTLGVTLVVPPVEILLPAAQVRIDAPADGRDPAPVEVGLSNAGGGVLSSPQAAVAFDEGRAAPWLKATVQPGAGPAPFALRLETFSVRSDLFVPTGPHWATVTLTAPGAAAPATLRVELVVPAGEPSMSSPASLTLTRVAGCGPPRSRSILVQVAGAGSLPALTATVEPSAAAWLTATVYPAETARVPIREASVGLQVLGDPPAGASATVTISAPGRAGTTFRVDVVDAPASPLTASLFVQGSQALRVQSGAGDPAPQLLILFLNHCAPTPPTPAFTYPAGTAPWLSAEAMSWDDGSGTYLAWVLRASATGLAAGQLRRATVRIPELEAAGAQPLELTLGVGGLEPAAPMATPRSSHALVALSWAGALAVGGDGPTGPPLASVERFDPSTRSWRPAGSLSAPRAGATAIEVSTGRVLVCGGYSSSPGQDRVCELGDTDAGTWTPAVTLLHPRFQPSLVHLAQQHLVLVVDDSAPAEIIDLATWTSTEAFIPGDVRGSATASFSDAVVAGGAQAAVYDSFLWWWSGPSVIPATGGRPAMSAFWDGYSGGNVLVLGGEEGRVTAQILAPWAGTSRATAPSRTSHEAGGTVALPNGRVAAAAGFWNDASAAVELFDGVTETWTAPVSFPTSRAGTRAVALYDGTVLFAGGYDALTGLRTAEAYTW